MAYWLVAMTDFWIALAFYGLLLVVFCVGGALSEKYLLRGRRAPRRGRR